MHLREKVWFKKRKEEIIQRTMRLKILLNLRGELNRIFHFLLLLLVTRQGPSPIPTPAAVLLLFFVSGLFSSLSLLPLGGVLAAFSNEASQGPRYVRGFARGSAHTSARPTSRSCYEQWDIIPRGFSNFCPPGSGHPIRRAVKTVRFMITI